MPVDRRDLEYEVFLQQEVPAERYHKGHEEACGQEDSVFRYAGCLGKPGPVFREMIYDLGSEAVEKKRSGPYEQVFGQGDSYVDTIGMECEFIIDGAVQDSPDEGSYGGGEKRREP